MKTPVNHFRKNRKQVHIAAENSFLRPLTADDLPFEITETKNKAGEGKLRKIRIDNIPINDDYPVSYVLDMELEGSVFSRPQHCKTVEKVILLFSCWSLYVIMIEMKTSLKLYDSGISEIEEKIKDSVGRVSLFLTQHILDVNEFDDYPIKYYTLVFYNNESIKTELTYLLPSLNSNDLVKIFLGKQKPLFVTEPFGICPVEVIFKMNPVNSEEFEQDLNTIFEGDEDFENAGFSDKTLPILIA